MDGSSLEWSEGCVELCCSIGFTLDKDCSSDGSNGLRALDGDDILALLLVVDFLQDDKYKYKNQLLALKGRFTYEIDIPRFKFHE